MGVGATVVMLFTAFASSVLVRRSLPDWEAVDLPDVLWVGIGLLVVSSAALELATARARLRRARARDPLDGGRGAPRSSRSSPCSSSAGRSSARRGVFHHTRPHASFFYMISAVHGVHVLAGLIVLGTLAWRLRREEVGAFGRMFRGGIAFWHLLGVIWLGLFVLLQTG